jgi:hypothetical protein
VCGAVVIRRDITELWDALLEYQNSVESPARNILAAFRNCGAGYHHYFDMKNQFVLGRFVPRRYVACVRALMSRRVDWVWNQIVTVETCDVDVHLILEST